MSENYHVVLSENLAVSTTYESVPVYVGNKSNFAIGVAPVGTFTGDIYLEGSNDREDAASIPNWFLVTDSQKSFTSEEVMYDVSDFGYSWVRVGITLSSGSITGGKVDLSLKEI